MPSTGMRPAAPQGVATIQDVATRAGVSTATVSRALATPDRVALATREAVFSAIREIGYTPNAAARSLRAKSSRMVLVLLPGIGNSFFTPVLTELEEVFAAGGYGVLIGYKRRSIESGEAHYARLVRAGQVDGILIVAEREPDDDTLMAMASQVPTSMMFAERSRSPRYSVFDVANRAASANMIRYLIERGHRRIAHIVGPASSPESTARLEGYLDAMAEAGLPTGDFVWRQAKEFDFAGGEAASAAFFALPEPSRPTAVFAAADEIALGFMRALKNRGVNIPADVSVAGFDDTEYAVHYDPSLTTMRQPRVEMGRRAAEELLRRMTSKDEPVPTSYVRFDCELVERESVRRIGGS